MRDRIQTVLKRIKGDWFEESQNLILGGYINSFELLKLISELEKEFNIKISLSSIMPENFNSVEKIEMLICEARGNNSWS